LSHATLGKMLRRILTSMSGPQVVLRTKNQNRGVLRLAALWISRDSRSG
jgi:hypothetical protein